MIFAPLKTWFFSNISNSTHAISIMSTFLDSLGKSELETTEQSLVMDATYL